jgi:hypothetical protein
MKEHRFSQPFTSFGREQCISPDEIILPKAIFLTWRHVLTLTRVATVSVPIVAETCARRGAGFSRFLQLVPGEGESQTTGKLCVLHFFYKGQLNIASLCNGRTKRKWGAMLNFESGDRIQLFYEDSPEAIIRATVNRLFSDRDEGMGLV